MWRLGAIGTGTNTATRVGFAWTGSAYRGSFGYDGNSMTLVGNTGKAVALFSNGSANSSLTLSGNSSNVGIGGVITDSLTLAGADVFVNGTSGNVGIGTTSPQNSLDVNGGMAIGSYAGNNAAGSGNLIVSGNVGIGTTGPGAPLDVQNGSVVGGEKILLQLTNSGGTGTVRLRQ